MTAISGAGDRHKILVVDDEPDILAVTKLGLKGLKYGGQRVTLITADTGAGAVELLKSDPNIAVVLLDVVMENDAAGLDACRAMREDNKLVRILLRTGQPGAAPEKETIEQYDIDGYLPKAEMTGNRLYTAVRTAIKAWGELVQLERHRKSLAAVHDLALSLHANDALSVALDRILDAATKICPAKLAVLHMETFDAEGDTQTYALHLSADDDEIAGKLASDAARSKVAASADVRSAKGPVALDGGVYVPLVVPRELGHGWLYLADTTADDLADKALTLLAGHAANALYANVALHNLEAREGDVFEAMAI